MRAEGAWLVALLAIATLSGCGKPEPEPPPAPPPLSKQGLSLSSWKSPSPDRHDRLLLAHALAKGDTEAMVLIATEVGKTPAVAQAIAALGGDIQTRFDDVGYLRVRLALERFAEVEALPDVLMADLDGGGAHGLYENDRDLVRYPTATPQAARASSDHGDAAPMSAAGPRTPTNASMAAVGPRTPTVAASVGAAGPRTPAVAASMAAADTRTPTDAASMAAADTRTMAATGARARMDVTATDTLLGAEIASPATTLAAEIEALLQAAVDKETNVLARDEDGGRFPGGGSDLFALMANRVVEVHGKPMLSATGAFGRVEGVTGASSGRRVIAVGEYIHAEAALSDGDDSDATSVSGGAGGALPATASLGPASDGAPKPDVLAPDGFENAASATESLIAAARAENLPADARHINWALRMGARRLDNYQAHEQGFGVLDTTQAKELLEQVQARKFDLPDIQTRAPVKTYLSRFLPEPGVGQGLYEREGWLIRQKDTRTITLLRQSGAPTPLSYSLQWRGNDGTFKTAQDEVTLPLHEPVQLELEISPQQLGIHSAHLYLIDKATELPVHAVMTTIVAAEPFTAANRYLVEHREEMPDGAPPKRYFLDVPPNISSLRIDAAIGSGRAQILLDGGSLDLPPSKVIASGQPAVLLVPYPPSGVYELTVVPTNTPATNLRISASTYFVDSQLDEKPAANNSTMLWMNNIYAPLKRGDILTEIGMRRVLKDVGGPSGMRAYNIAVEPDSGALRVAASPSDGRTRMGIYLYDCATGSCKLWGSDVFTRPAAKALVVPNPRAGLWRVVVDATAPGAAFEYTQIVSHPRFGNGAVEGESEERRTGARWNQRVSFQVSEAPPFGYDLVGLMDVVDSGAEADERGAPFTDWSATGDNRDLPLRPLRLSTQVMRLEVGAARSPAP